MTWAELKKKIEELGIKDDDEIWYIDVNAHDEIEVERHINGWKIW